MPPTHVNGMPQIGGRGAAWLFRVSWASPRAAAERCACAQRPRNWVRGGARRERFQTRKWVSVFLGLQGVFSRRRGPGIGCSRPWAIPGSISAQSSSPLEISLPSPPAPDPLFQFHSGNWSPPGSNELREMSLLSSVPTRAGPDSCVQVRVQALSLPSRYPLASETQVHSLSLDEEDLFSS